MVPGLVIFAVLLLMPTPDGLSLEGQRTMALFIFIAYLWITETFPLPVTAFLMKCFFTQRLPGRLRLKNDRL